MPQQLQIANQTIEREPFRWRFEALFADGHVIEQPLDDKSINHVEGAEHNPSAFTDVLDYQNTSPLVKFGLFSTQIQQMVIVDLVDGTFNVNNVLLCAHNQFFEPSRYPLELVYFRENRVEFDQENNPSRHYINRYFIGWKTLVNGKPKQVTLAVG